MQKVKKITRGMPNNVEAEASVLGSILIDNKAADNIIPMLKLDDFYLAPHRIIFGVMKELQNESKPIDTVSVADKLDYLGKLDEVGSVTYLAELSESVPSAANAEYYANIIKRDALTRRVIQAANSIAQKGYDSETGTEALEYAEKEIYGISEEESVKSLLKADDALANAIKGIQDVQTGNVPQNVIQTDFPSLDKKTRGLKPGELILLAARPSVGKTAFCLNIAANACLNHGKTVAIFSLEMPSALLAKRMLAYVSKVSLSSMDTRGKLSAADNAKLFKAYNALLAANLFIDDYSMNGPGDVLSKCRRLKRETGLDLIIIDYLQLMTLGDNDSDKAARSESRQVEVSSMSRKMKIYAKELDVPIILLSQMSRGVEKRDDHSPLLSDLRESGSIEQDADVVMFLSNPSKFNPALPENQVKLDVKKNRNGPIGEITLEWDGETTSFKECLDSEIAGALPERKSPSYEKANVNSQTTSKNSDNDNPVEFREVATDVMPFKVENEAVDEKLIEYIDIDDEKNSPFKSMPNEDKNDSFDFDGFEDDSNPTDDDVPDEDEYVDDDELPENEN